MSFDNLSGIKGKKYNLGILILLTFLALLFSMFIPVLGILGAAIMPLPSSLLIVRGRIRDGFICAAVSSIVMLLMGYIMPPVVMAIIIAVAFIHRYAIEKEWQPARTIVVVFAVFIAAIVVYLLLYRVVYGPGLFSEWSSEYNAFVEGLSEDAVLSGYASLMGASKTEMKQVIVQMQPALEFMPKLLPGIMVVSLAVISIVNFLASSKIYRSDRVDMIPMKPFKAWDLPWHFVWGFMVGLALILVPELGSPAIIDSTVDIVGFNLLIIFGTLYAVLGFSVMWGIFVRYKVALFLRIMILAILVLFPLAVIFIPFLGIADIWVNFRKLERA